VKYTSVLSISQGQLAVASGPKALSFGGMIYLKVMMHPHRTLRVLKNPKGLP